MARKSAKKIEHQKSAASAVLFAGLFLIALGLFTCISLATADITADPVLAAEACPTGLFGVWQAYYIVTTVGGSGAWAVACLLIAWGGCVLNSGEFWTLWSKVLGGALIVFFISMISGGALGTDIHLSGLLGHALVPEAVLYMGSAGLLIFCAGALFFSAVLTFGAVVMDMAKVVWAKTLIVLNRIRMLGAEFASALSLKARPKIAGLFVTAADRAVVLVSRPLRTTSPAPAPVAAPVAVVEPEIEEAPREVEAAVIDEESEVIIEEPDYIPYGIDNEDIGPVVSFADAPAPKKSPKPKAEKKSPAQSKVKNRIMADGDFADYQLPPMNLLEEPVKASASFSSGTKGIEKRAKVLEETLQEFKIDGKVVQIQRGPRVTLFEMTLAAGIRLNRVINLADNISMALKASSVRIIAPIPGKDTIGIEIPNVDNELVCLREIVEAVDRNKRKQMLPLCLAKDVSGKPVVADLSKMPHLLIAGATGSGKSVCINSVILSFLMCCKPSEVKLIMVDPKVVELSRFKEIPHLMSPVITDMKRAVSVLEWACQKMDERYERLSMVNVNNIAKFNALGEEKIREILCDWPEEELETFPKKLPCIVIIIDELADLMMVSGKEVEHHITRLAAKSRAVGIHLILATQRPSVDVITGLIKANMPSRIAFQVASKVDSRTILDQNGAESLLGAGDMLYLPPGVSKVTRSQGVFVSDEELFAVVDFCKAQMAPDFHDDLKGPVIGGSVKADTDDFDDLFFDAGIAILESGRGSVSLLQRKLGIGYGRASRIIDQLASVAVLGPFREGKAREILLTPEDFSARFGGGAMSNTQEELPLAGVMEDEVAPEALPWDEDETE